MNTQGYRRLNRCVSVLSTVLVTGLLSLTGLTGVGSCGLIG
jgi:hypothetical protein